MLITKLSSNSNKIVLTFKIQHMAEMTQQSSEKTNNIEKSIDESSLIMNGLNTEAQKQSDLAHNLNEIVSKFTI